MWTAQETAQNAQNCAFSQKTEDLAENRWLASVTLSAAIAYLQGKKEYTQPPWHPLSLALLPDPKVTEQQKLYHFLVKTAMVYAMSLCKQETRVYTIGPERVYTIEVSDHGFHGGGVYFFLPCTSVCFVVFLVAPSTGWICYSISASPPQPL